MLLWFIKVSIISILLIVIIHHLFYFLQSNFTIPIVKDYIDINEKYENMINTIQEKDGSLINDLPTKEEEKIENNSEENINMKIELKNYLNEL